MSCTHAPYVLHRIQNKIRQDSCRVCIGSVGRPLHEFTTGVNTLLLDHRDVGATTPQVHWLQKEVCQDMMTSAHPHPPQAQQRTWAQLVERYTPELDLTHPSMTWEGVIRGRAWVQLLDCYQASSRCLCKHLFLLFFSQLCWVCGKAIGRGCLCLLWRLCCLDHGTFGRGFRHKFLHSRV